jgi:hypothetical protein
MVALTNKLGPFVEVGVSNSEIGSEGKLGDNEDLEKKSRKEPKKEKPSSIAIIPSQYLFKMEVKVYIKPYQGEINVLKLNDWLNKLEVYFSVHNIDEDKNISFSQLKLEGQALTWWEIHVDTLGLEGDLLVNKWEDLKTLIKSQVFPIVYVEDQWILWNYFMQRQGKSVQEYTTKFRNMDIMMSISPKNPDALLKYGGGCYKIICERN